MEKDGVFVERWISFQHHGSHWDASISLVAYPSKETLYRLLIPVPSELIPETIVGIVEPIEEGKESV